MDLRNKWGLRKAFYLHDTVATIANLFDTLRPGEAHMRRWAMATLVQWNVIEIQNILVQ